MMMQFTVCAPHNAHVHQTKLEEEDKKIKGGDVQQKNNEKNRHQKS
jgi:hypothetical protein